MKIDKPLAKRLGLLNLSIHRAVLDYTGDFLSALIVEHIHHRILKNDKKEVWLKVDWIHKKLPYISRAGLAKKLKKLEADGHILVKRGEGKHYHKCWYNLSANLKEACQGKALETTAKVYYNPEIAEKHIEASVVYATIVSLLKLQQEESFHIKGSAYGKIKATSDQLLLDYAKLVEGSGLSLGKVRKAVRWLINHRKIVEKKVFGNKRLISMPPELDVKPADLDVFFSEELPTECFPHAEPEEELPTESFPHKGD